MRQNCGLRKDQRTTGLVRVAVLGLVVAGCGRATDSKDRGHAEVIVYTALDQEFSEPLLESYAHQTGVSVLPKFDVESTKTVGLTQQIMAEAARPRCDLFWNNEVLNTIRLRNKGLLEPFRPVNAENFPAIFRAQDKTWYGFAARARILLVNTRLVGEKDRPKSILDLAEPKWRGRTGIAKPLFGTTATHAACLFAAWGSDKASNYFRSLKKNEVQVLSGNKQVATAVGAGELLFGLTDTDDAMGEVEAGQPVVIVYPDRGENELGTLFIPNTIAIVKGAPHRAQAEALANHLLSPEVETLLATGPSAQIPLNSKVTSPARVETPRTVHAMGVDFEKAAQLWDEVAAFLAAEFAGP